jgi:deoxyribose-phosphate aldolase
LGDIKLFNAVIGDRIKIKSAGWIINLEDAIGSIEFGASRVGNSLGPLWLSEWDQNHWYDQLKKI